MLDQEKASLYDRLGGLYNIATVVDDLIDRVMADPRLNANPRVDEAHHRVSPAGFKYYVTELVCQAFDRFGVPEQEQEELKAIVQGTKESIVVRPFQEGPEEPVGTAGGGGARRTG